MNGWITHLLPDTSRSLAGDYSLPQIPRNEESDSTHRLNLAKLNPNTILYLLPTRETNRPRDSPTLNISSPNTSTSSSESAEEGDVDEYS